MQTFKIFSLKKLVKGKSISLLFILAFSLSGCGFQLNTNEPALIASARSISVESIENNTYVPGVDLALRQDLIQKLVANKNIRLASGIYGELRLRVTISRIKQTIADYSVQSDNYYRHLFQVTAKVQVADNRKQKEPASNSKGSLNNSPILSKTINGSHEIRSTEKSLSAYEISEARDEAVIRLSEQIYTSLTASF